MQTASEPQAAAPPQSRPEPQPQDQPSVAATPKLASELVLSGPLPEIEGFDELKTLVDNNPNDIGSHMALAAAYTQLGDLDTALRVYRRVLKKRIIPPTFLRLIQEELNDFSSELTGNAHYHQVRGDLYMKQGRHHEAIEEYNKIT